MRIVVTREYEEPYGTVELGIVIPPDHYHYDTRAKEGKPFWTRLIDFVWDEWEASWQNDESVDPPDTDDEFINWLVNEKDFVEADPMDVVNVCITEFQSIDD